jgi:hypothetical protein
MQIRDEGYHINAMLRHLGCGGDLRDFPATANERVALVRIADARGLIAWRKGRARYELTHFGWNELLPKRRFGVPSLIISAATGGMAAVIAVAVFWLPADGSHPRVHSSASLSRLEKPRVPQTARSAEICVPTYAPLPAIRAAEDAGAPAPDAETNEPPRPASDLTTVAEPKTEPGVSGVKEAGAKKSRKTAHHRRRDQGRNWAYADAWRRSIRYAGYDGQRGWFGYR